MRICFFDAEANGLLPEVTEFWCAVTKEMHTGVVKKYRRWDHLLHDLDSIDVLIGHNVIGYDLPMLRKLFGYEFKGKVVDTLLMSRLQKPHRFAVGDLARAPHSVEAWGQRFGRLKPVHEDWSRYSPEMLHRCSEDVEIQEMIYKALMAEAKGLEWANAHKLTFKLFDILQRQEEYGWLVDQPHMHKCIRLLDHWINKIDQIVQPLLPMVCVIEETKKDGEYNYVRKPYLKSGHLTNSCSHWMYANSCGQSQADIAGPFSRISFRQVDLNSNEETKEWLLNEGWQPEQWNTDSDGKRTSPKLSHLDHFEGINSARGRLIARRVQCRHRRSNIEGWFKHLRPDGRVPTPVSGLAETYRAKHKIVVNVPGEEAFFGNSMRRCFVCKPGYRIVGTDSAGCQARMLAARVGDPAFTEILVNGDKEKGTSIHQVNQKAIKEIANIEVAYRVSKNLNFAFMFGAQDPKLASTAHVDTKYGPLIRKALLSISPGFEKLIEELTAEWRSHAKSSMKWGKLRYFNGWVRGLDGRPVYISKEPDVLVYMLQSDEAIMMQAAYCMLYKRANDRGWVWGEDWAYLIWSHDEYQAEVKEEIAEEFSKIAEQCIVDAGKFFKIACPHQGESKIGNNWQETH